MIVFLSNQREVLADRLKERLFHKGAHPLARRLVIVPSRAMRNFLLFRFARDPDLKVAAGIEVVTLHSGLAMLTKELRIPSQLELSLLLEYEIATMDKTDERFLPLFHYLGESDVSLRSFCVELARVFSGYGFYGNLEKWEKKKSWQQALWKRLKDKGWGWQVTLAEPTAEIHLFGFSYLPPNFLPILLKFPCYFFSPCALYWGDFSSKSEKRKLYRRLKEKQKEEFDSYLDEQHPLLANWGRAGREFFGLLDQFEIDSEEDYVDPEGEAMLNRLQRSILTLQPLSECEKDDSIQIHKALSRLQEVEVLFQKIARLKLPYGEIVVMAPNMQAYAPYIHQVFGSESSRIPYSIENLKISSQKPLIQAALHLLSLNKKRFDVASISHFLSFSAMQKKWKFSETEVNQMRKWLENAHIYWGVDQEQRNVILKSDMTEKSESGTWEQEFERLVLALCLPYIEEESPPFTEAIELSEAELLGRLIRLVRQLKTDLMPMIDGSKKTALQWIDLLKKLMSDYFVIEDDERVLFHEWDHLALSLKDLEEPVFSYDSIEETMEHLFHRAGANFNAAQINSVRFFSLIEGAAIPASAICLLGMDEEIFPRVEKKSSLSELEAMGAIASPTDCDRYLFLEILLSAKSNLLLFFSSEYPSLLLEELEAELIKKIPAFAKIIHAPTPTPNRPPPPPLIPEFSQKANPSPLAMEEPLVIPLRLLKQLARHPIEFFFKQTLQIYLQEEKKPHPEFLFSPIKRSMLRKLALRRPFETVCQTAEKRGELPLGSFKEASLARLQDEFSEVDAQLSDWGIDKREIYSIELKATATEIKEEKPGSYIYPALQVGNVKIVGKLSDIFPQGLLSFSNSKSNDIAKLWPELLVFLSLKTASQPQLLLFKDGKILENFPQDPLASLQGYIEYYKKALTSVSPLMPDWIEALMRGTPETLEKAIHKSAFPDTYIDWYLRRDKELSAQAIFDLWAPYSKSLFGGDHDLF